MMKCMRKSKKGVTLVESVFAVVILGILTIGILSLLGTGGAKIVQISHESNAHSEAVQKLDLVISTISNGSATYIIKEPEVSLDVDALMNALAFDSSVTLNAEIVLYEEGAATITNCRGWYLTLTCNGATVKGFASNSEGVFDKS